MDHFVAFMCLRAEFALSTVTTVTGAIDKIVAKKEKHQIATRQVHHY